MRKLYRVQVTLHVECQKKRFLSKQLNCESKHFKAYNYDLGGVQICIQGVGVARVAWVQLGFACTVWPDG